MTGFAQTGNLHASLIVSNSSVTKDFIHIYIPKNKNLYQWTY